MQCLFEMASQSVAIILLMGSCVVQQKEAIMDEKEILVFRVGGLNYGVNVSDLKGIEEGREVTSVAKAPEYIKGIVNIRDEVFPVLDVAAKLAVSNADDAQMKLLIMSTNAGKVACLVDEVSEITVARGNDIQTFPKMLRVPDTTYAECVVRKDDKLIIIIDSNHLFDDKEVEQIEKMKG